MGISAMYNFIVDPDPGIGKISIDRLLRFCDGCLKPLNSVQEERTNR